MEETYIIMSDIVCEGLSEVFYGTKEEALEWLRDPHRVYYLNNLHIYHDGPDVFNFLNNE